MKCEEVIGWVWGAREWQEHYSSQTENERYLNYVADKFDLHRHIQFNSREATLVYDEADNRWNVTTDDGHQIRAQFVITAIGILPARYVPEFEGLDSYLRGRYRPAQFDSHPEYRRRGSLGNRRQQDPLRRRIENRRHLIVSQPLT